MFLHRMLGLLVVGVKYIVVTADAVDENFVIDISWVSTSRPGHLWFFQFPLGTSDTLSY